MAIAQVGRYELLLRIDALVKNLLPTLNHVRWRSHCTTFSTVYYKLVDDITQCNLRAETLDLNVPPITS